MDAEQKISAVKATARWWRDKWLNGHLNDVQPAVVLDDVVYWLEHDEEGDQP